jgi:hypothetical protein
MIFSNDSMSWIGRSAQRKALAVTETSGSVNLGRAVAIICRDSRGLMNSVECKAEAIPELTAVNIAANEDLGPQPRLETFNEIVSLLLEHRVVVGDSNKFIVTESFMDPTSPLQEYSNFKQIGHAW